MFYLRYGIPNVKDCFFSLLLISLLYIFGILSLLFSNFYYGITFFLVATGAFIYVLLPYFERFQIDNNRIIIRKFMKELQIDIPITPTLVISEADVHELLGHQSFYLHNKYAITILNNLPLELTLDLLFGRISSQHRYTNSTIELQLAEHFVYSFAIDRKNINQILDGIDCRVVIPQSLVVSNNISNLPPNVYIDARC